MNFYVGHIWQFKKYLTSVIVKDRRERIAEYDRRLAEEHRRLEEEAEKERRRLEEEAEDQRRRLEEEAEAKRKEDEEKALGRSWKYLLLTENTFYHT